MTEDRTEFEEAASARPRGLVGEMVDFLKHNKKLYLIPIFVVLLGLGLLIVFGGTAAAPFIYTMF